MKKLAKKLAAFALLIAAIGFTSCEEELIDGEPVLTASSEQILADGNDALVMKVTVNGKDVTKNAKFFMNHILHKGNTFTTTTPSDYTFYAEYNKQRTNSITVKAMDTRLHAEIPEDTCANQFENFAHKVLLIQATGTWCGWCPNMIRGIELFREEQANADKVVVVAAHCQDNLSSKASDAIHSTCMISSWPTCLFNLNKDTKISSSNPTVNAVNLNTKASMELKEEARVGIAAASKIAGSKTSVRAAVKVGVSGAYRINAWLVENDVEDIQSDYTGLYGDQSLLQHDFVLRDASYTTPIFGELLGSKEECAAGETLEFYHEFDGKNAGILDMTNCKIVVLVSAQLEGSTRFAVNNVIELPVGESVGFAYN